MKHLTHRLSLLALVAVLPLWAGCDSDRPKETVVYGTVLDAQTGQPLKDIPFELYTVPSGPGSYRLFQKGKSDGQGKFSARTTAGCCINLGINGGNEANMQYWGKLYGVKENSTTYIDIFLESRN